MGKGIFWDWLGYTYWSTIGVFMFSGVLALLFAIIPQDTVEPRFIFFGLCGLGFLNSQWQIYQRLSNRP